MLVSGGAAFHLGGPVTFCVVFQKAAAVKPAVPARKKDTSSSSEESDSEEEPAKSKAAGEILKFCALISLCVRVRPPTQVDYGGGTP